METIDPCLRRRNLSLTDNDGKSMDNRQSPSDGKQKRPGVKPRSATFHLPGNGCFFSPGGVCCVFSKVLQCCRHISQSHMTDVMSDNVRKDGVLPERIQEELDPLACPHQGEDSPERGWELLLHSTTKQTDRQREVQLSREQSSRGWFSAERSSNETQRESMRLHGQNTI